ncbi:MAG: hypothetical protein HC923_05555 [Myxococcales bacterium]|nr:hypothetical protein [Myxococcales bacterium]
MMKRALTAILLVAASPAAPAMAQGTTVSFTVAGAASTFQVDFLQGHNTAREVALRRAVEFWADRLNSSVSIHIEISFETSLPCSNTSAVLGSAGPNRVFQNFTSAPLANTFYVVALANSRAGIDLAPGIADLSAIFNARLDDPGFQSSCLQGADWFYGVGPAPSQDISFYDVALHELAHGLGFLTFVEGNGQRLNGDDDVFLTFLQNRSTGVSLAGSGGMTNAQRAAALTNNGNLVWTGPAVTAAASVLTAGRAGTRVRMHAPSSYQPGSSTSHFDEVLSPDELMEPSSDPLIITSLSEALMRDLGWLGPNATPQITGQALITIDEDTPRTLLLADLTVVDPDNVFPDDFSLSVGSGMNFTRSGARITPSLNYNGPLSVPVTVSDGIATSASFPLAITVRAVNDAPVVTAQAGLSIPEDTPLDLTAEDFTIVDPDDDTFDLRVLPGSGHTAAGPRLSPAPDFFGTLTATVVVNDGEVDSAPFAILVEVTPVNDPPVIAGVGPLSVPEDGSLVLAPEDFLIVDPDDDTFQLEVMVDRTTPCPGRRSSRSRISSGFCKFPCAHVTRTSWVPCLLPRFRSCQ